MTSPGPTPDDTEELSSPKEPTDSTLPDSTSSQAVTGETRAKKSLFREYSEAIIIAMILAFTIRVFVVQAFKIPSGSMIPSLLIGDHILVSKLAYGLQWPQDCVVKLSFPPMTCYASSMVMDFGTPQRGDVIVFRYPEDEEKDFIKRVIGLPGDSIQIRNKIVYVNGKPTKEDAYTQHLDPALIDGRINPRDNYGPVTVPSNSYFVMGDNRDHSLDSRFWGFVQSHKIKGRAFLVYWSWNGVGTWIEWVRWERIGKFIR